MTLEELTKQYDALCRFEAAVANRLRGAPGASLLNRLDAVLSPHLVQESRPCPACSGNGYVDVSQGERVKFESLKLALRFALSVMPALTPEEALTFSRVAPKELLDWVQEL